MNKQNKYFYDWGTRYADDDSDSGSSTVTSSSSDTSRDEAPQQPYLMVAQRSKRQRAQIQYNFDEFDEMIKKAVLSDDARTEYKREDALESHRGRALLLVYLQLSVLLQRVHATAARTSRTSRRRTRARSKSSKNRSASSGKTSKPTETRSSSRQLLQQKRQLLNQLPLKLQERGAMLWRGTIRRREARRTWDRCVLNQCCRRSSA